MKSLVEIVPGPIDLADRAGRGGFRSDMGAIVHFLGVVRDSEAGERIQAIEYEAFRAMAEHQFDLIFADIEKRWPIASIHLIHRVGRVAVGEPSLWVEVVGPHRGEAFAACQFLIDEMKRVVPIWKKVIPAPLRQPLTVGNRIDLEANPPGALESPGS